MIKKSFFDYRKQTVLYMLLYFLVFETVLVNLFWFRHHSFEDFHKLEFLIQSVVIAGVSLLVAQLRIRLIELRLFRKMNPYIEFILGKELKVLQINGKAKQFFGIEDLPERKAKLFVGIWVRNNIAKSRLFVPEKFEYRSFGSTVLFTKSIEPHTGNLLFFGVDITDQKVNEQEIRRLLTAIEQSAVSVVTTDEEGNITYANKAFEEITGFSRLEVFGKNPRIFSSGFHDAEFYSQLWQTISTGHDWTGTFLNRKKNGEHYWEEAIITPICNDENEITAFIALKEDITKRKQFEQELRLAKEEAEKANALKSEFLANMSHEIRTPLNAILGFNDILMSQEKDPEKNEMLKLMKKSGTDLLGLISEILDLSKIEADKVTIEYREFSVLTLFEELERQFSVLTAEKDIELEFIESTGTPDLLIGGEVQIKQVLTNLIGNAVKFTDSGFIRTSAAYENGVLQLEVADSGIGITDDVRTKIFDAFAQGNIGTKRKYEGTGLGLTISRRLVDLMDGSIDVESTPGKGSIFRVNIPLLPVSGHAEEEPLAVIPLDENEDETDAFVNGSIKTEQKNPEILVFFDEKVDSLLIQKILESSGIQANYTLEASEFQKLYHEGQYSIIILDFSRAFQDHMHFINTIHQNREKAPFTIIITGDAMAGSEEKYLDMGFDLYMSKPLDRRQLLEVITGHLGEGMPANENFGRYDLSGLSPDEFDRLSKELLNLENVFSSNDIDGLLSVSEKISLISDSGVVSRISEDLRRIWEHIDEKALAEFIGSMKPMIEKSEGKEDGV